MASPRSSVGSEPIELLADRIRHSVGPSGRNIVELFSHYSSYRSWIPGKGLFLRTLELSSTTCTWKSGFSPRSDWGTISWNSNSNAIYLLRWQEKLKEKEVSENLVSAQWEGKLNLCILVDSITSLTNAYKNTKWYWYRVGVQEIGTFRTANDPAT